MGRQSQEEYVFTGERVALPGGGSAPAPPVTVKGSTIELPTIIIHKEDKDPEVEQQERINTAKNEVEKKIYNHQKAEASGAGGFARGVARPPGLLARQIAGFIVDPSAEQLVDAFVSLVASALPRDPTNLQQAEQEAEKFERFASGKATAEEWGEQASPIVSVALGATIAKAAKPPATKLPGSGPASGVIEVSPLVKSTKAFHGYNPARPVEFVFDPGSSRFVVGSAKISAGGSPHQKLANTVDADPSRVVGGMFRRGPSGEILTNEFSGHFWQNWTPEAREQLKSMLEQMTGQKVIHHEGM